MKIKKFLLDLSLNSVSNFIIIAVIQFFLFPYLNKRFSIEYFGEITAIYGINSIILAFLGDSLNNLKIIYQEKSIKSFDKLSRIVSILTLFISLFFYFIYSNNISFFSIVIYALVTVLGVYRLYIGASLRIELDYKSIFISNILVAVGYILGLLVFLFLRVPWSIIFLIGESFGNIYIYKRIRINKIELDNQLERNKESKSIRQDYLNLSFTYGINGVSNYLDRILIIPILGAMNMSVFYAASVSSKIIIMLLGQFNTVFLAYLMKKDVRLKRKRVINTYVLLMLLLLCTYLPLQKFSMVMTKLLYPNLYSQSKVLIPFLTIGVLFYSLSNFTKIILLKFFSLNIQLYIQIVYTIFYVFLSYILSIKLGVKGFSYSYMIMSIISFILYLSVLVFNKKGSI